MSSKQQVWVFPCTLLRARPAVEVTSRPRVCIELYTTPQFQSTRTRTADFASNGTPHRTSPKPHKRLGPEARNRGGGVLWAGGRVEALVAQDATHPGPMSQSSINVQQKLSEQGGVGTTSLRAFRKRVM